MQLWARLKSLSRNLLRRQQVESQLEDEVRAYSDMIADEKIAAGIPAQEAHRTTLADLGGIEQVKQSVRDHRTGTGLELLWQDVRYALRILRKSPGFTAIAVASLALAIGANTTIFSYANQVLFVRLGVPHPEQLRVFRLTGDDHIAVREIKGYDVYVSDDGHFHLGLFPYPTYQQLRHNNRVVEDIFAFMRPPDVDITVAGTPEVGKVEFVSGNFYTQMQVKPQLGRSIEPADDGTPGGGAVAVISDSFWHRDLGRADGVIGKTIRVNLTPVTIIGVNPPNFSGPVAADTSAPEIFLPLSMLSTLFPDPTGVLMDPNTLLLQVMARSKPGISTAVAQAALDTSFNAAFRGTAIVNKGETVPRLSLEDGSRGITCGTRNLLQPLYIVLGLAGLVLLLACANIANLMLARASVRQREMSVRMALGAGKVRILRQVLIESLLLSAMGGFAGLVLGYTSRNLIPLLIRTGWDGGEMTVGFDWRVFGFTCAVTLITGIAFGIAPAWRSTRAEINTALKEGSQTSSKRRKAWSGKMIVGFQVALSTLLVISAIFFLRTLFNLNSVDPGFRTQHLLLLDVTPTPTRYTVSQVARLRSRVADAFAAIRGVQEVTYANHSLGDANSDWRSPFQREGALQDLAADPKKTGHAYAMFSWVGPHFFSTMSIPILAGRGFNAQDTENSVPVSVVNQALVRKFFPNTNPIGKRFFRGYDKITRLIEIVGVCADTRYSDMRQPTPPVHFDLDPQSPWPGQMTYIIRSPLQPAILVPSLRRAVQLIDPDLPLSNIRTQQQQIDASMQQERMFASLTAGFGLLALALACVGIYGIMAYTVSQRTNEIGIRFALGASRSQIRAMVLREAGWLAIAGVVVGLGVAIILMRLVQAMLYGLKPGDPLSLTASALLLLTMALIAGWLPAARASRVEPMEALRHE
jgi:predicted permease